MPLASPLAPLSETFKLHSFPTATKRIYLDFDGQTTKDPHWNGGSEIVTPAYSLDDDFTTFSDADKTAIQDVWARVSEDFAPFSVDVCTEEPSLDDLRNTGGADDRWGIRVIIGGTGSWYNSAGVAMVGSFSWSTDTPCFAFAGQSWKSNLNIVNQCISHEVGHTLGLSHDGPGYYGGHGTGPTSWVPIMGSGDKSLMQWSKGEYNGADNHEDDLAIIAGEVTTTYTPNGNGFGYRVDDHGNDMAGATAPITDVTLGIIERNTDVDMFKFTSAGSIKATIKPIAAGANLDVLAELLDSAGTVVATSNPLGAIDASFDITVSPGTYYIRVQGTGEGDPLKTGYTKYGSLGQYTLTIKDVVPPPVASISDVVVTEGNTGTTTATFTVTLSTAPVQEVSVAVATRNGTATSSDNDYVPLVLGTRVIFAPGQTSRTITVDVRGDKKFEPDETFSLVMSNPQGVVLGDDTGVCTIMNDDPDIPTVSVGTARMSEGNSGTTVVRMVMTLSKPSPSAEVTVIYRTIDGTATVADNDYVPIPAGTSIVFARGETSKTFDVQLVGDKTFEPDETFQIELQDATNASVSGAAGVVTIVNDDRDPATIPTVHLMPAVVLESSSERSMAEFVIQLTGRFKSPFWLNYKTADGSARSGSDYTAASGSIKVLPGETEKRVWVSIVGDALLESDEFFTLLVTPVSIDEVLFDSPLAASLGLPATQTRGFILDDDSRFFSVRPLSASVIEGAMASFAVDLNRKPGFGSALPETSFLASVPANAASALLKKINFGIFYLAGNNVSVAGSRGTTTPPSREYATGRLSFGYVPDGQGGLTAVTSRQVDILTARTAPGGPSRQLSRPLTFYAYGGTNVSKEIAAATVRVVVSA